jgi:hypothetical protein
MSAFLVSQRRFAGDDPALARALAVAYLLHERPRCLCTDDGVPMYVAKAGRGFVLKRMPYTGAQHAALCRSHDTNWNATTNRRPVRWLARRRAPEREDAQLQTHSEALGAGLRGLWHAAELTRWQPGFHGKRSWATVRRHLLAAATTSNESIAIGQRLYVPECFLAEQRDAIRTRRFERWREICASCVGADSSMVLIGELKKLSPASQRFEAVIRHMPDERFALADGLYSWMGERFAGDLTWWAAGNEIRLIVIASCRMAEARRPVIDCLHLMPVTLQWLPVRNAEDLTRLERLVASGRTFVVRNLDNSGQPAIKTSLANEARDTVRSRQPASAAERPSSTSP